MADLAVDTEPEDLGGGRFRVGLSAAWEIWGPMGGYVAAAALRSAGLAGAAAHPAAFSCHYLGVARFEPVDVAVETRRRGRAAVSQRVEVTQDGKPILDAMVWSAEVVDGLHHDETRFPEVPGPEGLASMAELMPDGAPPYPFWNNLDALPIDWEPDWPPEGPRPARWQQWLRFRPTATFADPWVDAARLVILVDLPSWPAAHRPHAWQEPPFVAPTLSLHVSFHQPADRFEWLLCDGTAPLSTRGLFGWTARVWAPDRSLLASGGGQCMFRRL